MREITLQPLAWGESRERLFQAIARDARARQLPARIGGRAGRLGRGRRRTATARSAARARTVCSRPGRRAFSIEPFSTRDGTADHLERRRDGPAARWRQLPIPTVRWRHRDLELEVTAFAEGKPGRLDGERALSGEEPGLELGAGDAVPGAPPVPGEPARPVPQHAGRDRPDSRDRRASGGIVRPRQP